MTELPVKEIKPEDQDLVHASLMEGSTLEGKDEDGYIDDVLILGFGHGNGRRYTKEAMAGAVGLYEGKAVYVNHNGQKPGIVQGTDAYDRFGIVTNPRLAPDGIRGRLGYLPSHPLASRVKDDIRLGLRCFGLSHEVEGDYNKNNPRDVVRISEVKRVALVSEPATTVSLMESKMTTEVTVQEAVDKAVATLRESLGADIAALKEQLKVAQKYAPPVVLRESKEEQPVPGTIPFSDPKAFKDFMRSSK